MTFTWIHRNTEVEATAPAQRSKLLNGVLVATPLFFMTFVGVYSRGYRDPHEVPSGTPAQDAQVFAYVPYVKATDKLFHDPSHSVDRKKLLSVAESWDKAVQADKLQPLLPVSFEDTPEDGPRGKIMTSNAQLVSAVLDDATTQAHFGNTSEAAKETLLAVRLSESLKYSNFHTVFLSNVQEKRALSLLRRISPTMNQTTREETRASLSALVADKDDLEALTRASRIQYYDYMERMSKEPVSIEDVHRTVLVTKRIASDPTSRDTMQYVRSTVLDSASDSGPEYLSELRLAWSADSSNRREVNELLDRI